MAGRRRATRPVARCPPRPDRLQQPGARPRIGPMKPIALALTTLVALAPVQSALAQAVKDPPPQPTKNGYLKAGIRLYNELEFSAALDQLKKAETFPGNSVNEDVLVHL